ncbi:hypothetical protein [Methylobacterium radiodurans]|uniref:Uncharacterized protein n=1 Tax=Methylobacterium radiodurans TaxID=2202828 RepID=A0A2U8VQ73_9HYPH|nr:hypothetical protein [Methylobacterium radiodurans]AWN35879.1 hypothetical protein DK427_09115 [Methylobacterium radiodurans]
MTVAAVMAAAAARFAPPDFIATVSGELINLFGFVIAAVLPAMALTATSLRGSGMSIKRLIQLRKNLEQQMDFWAGLVIMSFAGVAFVVMLKPYVACPPGGGTCAPAVAFSYEGWAVDARWANAVLGYISGLILSQLMNVLRGLRGLLVVNSEAAMGEAQQRFDDQMAETGRHIAQIRNPPGYGDTFELPEMTDQR